MATTLILQNTIAFVTPLLKNQPPLINGMEPALTAANTILSTILGPPFRWRFNRQSYNFVITAVGGTDYVKSIPDFGFIETQWLSDPQSKIHQLNGAIALPVDGDSMRPTRMAPQYDDNSGNITFRFDHKPDASYTVFLDYQRKPAMISSPASTWGCVPDEFGQIFNFGFLALMMLIINDSRFPIFEQWFIARLLGAQDGLTDQERDIFLGNWMRKAQTVARDQASVNMGIAGRGK